MANPKAAGNPQGSVADQVAAEVLALHQQQAAPAGTQAAPGNFGAKLKKAVPFIISALTEVGAIAADGHLSADEVKGIAGKIFEFLQAQKKAPAA